jgi:glycogen debranching enzyme
VPELIQVEDNWYVRATSARADERARVLKQGETFGIFDRSGDIRPVGLGEEGLYHQGTRFLSGMELKINGARPLVLYSEVRKDNSLLMVDLTTPDLYEAANLCMAKDTLHIFRAKLLWEGAQYEHIRLVNYGDHRMSLRISVLFEADYADIFEVRGIRRAVRGNCLPARRLGRELVLAYRGLDHVPRHTRIITSVDPDPGTGTRLYFSLVLGPRDEHELSLTAVCEIGERIQSAPSYERMLDRWNVAVTANTEAIAEVLTSNEPLNHWLHRSSADLHMLTTETRYGLYPHAGVPWFCTEFGRDGIITALQYLWMQPELARGVLNFLAGEQADTEASAQDAEPGKILHEARRGEMAALDEIPFRRYYGSVDATPLFIVLAGAYFDLTGDRSFIETIWANIERALDWIDRYGDMDRDGFVEYARESVNGLMHQGWKDSADAVFHANGQPARPPIALCEVQGYVFAAKQAAAKLAALLGEHRRAEVLSEQAEQLKRRFNEVFWCADIQDFALALDGEKRPCCVPASNAGHALFTGIASTEHAQSVAEILLGEDSFSGWGVRTIAQSAARFNPMSYHNGSVWPHDNGIIAMGLARYGFKDQALAIFTGLFQASTTMDLYRLPELFCGFPRLPGQGPTQYPVACSPQAWASGAPFHLLQALLGLTFYGEKPQLRIYRPLLPDYLDWLQIKNLRVGNAVLDLGFSRHDRDVAVNVLRKEGDVDVAAIF